MKEGIARDVGVLTYPYQMVKRHTRTQPQNQQYEPQMTRHKRIIHVILVCSHSDGCFMFSLSFCLLSFLLFLVSCFLVSQHLLCAAASILPAWVRSVVFSFTLKSDVVNSRFEEADAVEEKQGEKKAGKASSSSKKGKGK